MVDTLSPFTRAVEHVLAWEGEWATDPQGGRTRWGFAQASHPTLDLDALTRDDAIRLYRVHYWDPIYGDTLLPALALALFDSAVQHGPTTAVGMWQRVVGAYPLDGQMGPLTLARTAGCDVPLTLRDYHARRAVRYAEQPAFMSSYRYGWMRRLMSTFQAATLLHMQGA